MAEDHFTLTTFYSSWKAYQDHIKGAIAMLTTQQLALRAAPHLRSVGENALHIIACRAGWFTEFLGEDCGTDVKAYASWDEPGAPARTPAEMVQASTAPGSAWRIAWRAGVPTICDTPSLTTGTANRLTCRAPGSSGM